MIDNESDVIPEWVGEMDGDFTSLGYLNIVKAAYFFKSRFWDFELPPDCFKNAFDNFDCFVDMSDSVKNDIMSSEDDLKKNKEFIYNLVDYAGHLNVINNNVHGRWPIGAGFVRAADEAIDLASRGLVGIYANRRSVMQLRDAVELLLKSFIYLKLSNIDNDSESRVLGHNLVKMLDNIYSKVEERPNLYSEFWAVKKKYFYDTAKLFPETKDKFDSIDMDLLNISICYEFVIELRTFIIKEILSNR